MTRSEIIQEFRVQNPEITDRVITDAQLNSFCLIGNQEICARARLIVNDDSFSAVEDESAYDLTGELTNFYDIDEIPGGGISTVDTSSVEKRLIKTSISELDDKFSSWRTASSGTPKYYYRRGKYVNLYPKPDSTISTIHVYFVAIADDFDDDNKTPYNQLTHLEPFHYGIVHYLTWRAKSKVGKPEESAKSQLEYLDYVKWITKEIGGGKHSVVYLRPRI